MQLKRILIKNFLSFSEAEIDFSGLHKVLIIGMDAQGSLSESNGAGKTNLVNAIGWAVWGKSKAKTLDENVKMGESSCSVCLEFLHEGKECSITRTRNANSKSSTIDFIIDGVPSNGSSITETDDKIIDFLKINYKTYVNSVYMKQNDLYSLANPESPNDGRTVLERVLNIEEYDSFEKRSKNKTKELEKEVIRLDAFIESNKDIEQKIETTKVMILEDKNNIKVGEESLKVSLKKLKQDEDKYTEIRDGLSELNLLNQNLSKVNSDINNKNVELSEKIEEGKKELSAKNIKVSSLELKISEKESIEKSRITYLDECEKSTNNKIKMEEIKQKIESIQKEVSAKQSILNKCDSECSFLNTEFNKLNNDLLSAKSKMESITIQAGETCPTCMGDISQHNIESIKSHRKEKYDSIFSSIKENRDKFKTSEASLSSIKLEIQQLNKNISLENSLIDNLRSGVISDKQHQETLELFANRLNQIERYKIELQEVKDNKLLINIKNRCNQLKDEIKAKTEEKSIIENKINELSSKAKELALAETNKNNSKNTFDFIQEKQYKLQASLENNENKLKDFDIINKQHQEALENLSIIKQDLVVLEQLNFAFSSKGVRAKLIKDAITELEQESDTLLRRISNGKLSLKFITEKEVKDGEKVVFEVNIIKPNGNISPYHLESGGQQLRISFVIRLALSKLLMKKANSKIEFLIIDEAIQSLDRSGIDYIMEIINETQNDFKNVLVITHREDVKSMFDQVIGVVGNTSGQDSRIWQE